MKTYQLSHKQDNIANNRLLGSPSGKIDGVSEIDYYNDDDEIKTHGINTFWDEVSKLPEGKYIVVDGNIISQ